MSATAARERYDNAETVGHEVTVGTSDHPRFNGKPALNIRQVLSGAGGGVETIYSLAVLDDLIEQLQRGRQALLDADPIRQAALDVILCEHTSHLARRLYGARRRVQISAPDRSEGEEGYRIDLNAVRPIRVASLDVAKAVLHEAFGVTEWRRVESEYGPDVTYQPLDGDCEAW